MSYRKITAADLEVFAAIVGRAYVLTDGEALKKAASDETEDLEYIPEAVIKPDTAEEISRILAYCNEYIIPVTVRGAGTGLSGGALAVYGGVVLDMSRMNRILNMDAQNFQVTTEPGVITQVLQEYVQEQGLFYPPDPSSRGSCFIGGNVAENSGGPRAVKYGVVKDYVLNLEVVLASGEIIWTGANVLKNATGYNLTQLVVGSEGTLGVVTKIVLRLIPAVQHNVLMLVPFRSAIDACTAVNEILLSGITPSALEFMERQAILLAMEYTGNTSLPLADATEAQLLIELDGNDMHVLLQQSEQVTNVLGGFETGEILFADSHEQKEALWALRRKVGEAVKNHSVYKEEDTVVPRAELPQLLAKVKSIGAAYGFTSVCYGHAGDGNLHVNIIKGNMSDDDWNSKLSIAIRELFAEVVKMGGTLSGEHGIGLVQKGYMNTAFNTTQLRLMKSIKNIFDPNDILNPGKIFPDYL
jgi:glycolate oxidase